MADTILKTKVQLRSTSVPTNGNGIGDDKTPTTPTTPSKLMLNHGKPNFTIQRSPKIQQNGNSDPLANAKNNNYNAFKTASPHTYNNNYNKNNNNNNTNNIFVSTKFNGAYKPTNNSNQSDTNDNEAARVVLRRTQTPEATPLKDNDEDETVPEFIRRQRRIQERLAKENILDFENRRSGYFTQVMISPTSPNRQSFTATMSSPPVVPALETSVLTSATPSPEESKKEEQHEEPVVSDPVNSDNSSLKKSEITEGEPEAEAEAVTEEEEVAKAIEEVNKAVEGEDDEKDDQNVEETIIERKEHLEGVTAFNQSIEEGHKKIEEDNIENNVEEKVVVAAAADHQVEIVVEHNVENVVEHNGNNCHEELKPSQQNGHVEVVEVHLSQENGHDHDHAHDHNDVTISHTNGFDGPSIPAPDPSGALGVNYEPKTVVSFSKELGSEPNKYPDTVKIISQNGDVNNEELQELTKMKFDIKANEQDVQVIPVPRTD